MTFVSFISPHYPLIAPQQFFDLYDPDAIPLPKKRPQDETASSGWWQAFEKCYTWDRFFASDDQRRLAIAGYYGLISFIDDHVGAIMRVLEETNLIQSTRVIFLSDHGENLGARALWGKSTMYNESVGIPMIACGPGIPADIVKQTPVSLIDMYPTVLQSAGVPILGDMPGRSLVELAELPDDISRPVFSEYHATAAKSATYMIRQGRYKYIHYVGYPPELYDLESDPEELANLALQTRFAGLIHEFESILRTMLDPEAIDRAAKADQERLIDFYGGREAVVAKGGKSATPAPTMENTQ